MVEYRIMPHYYERKLSGIVHINDNDTTATPLYEISHSVGSVFQNPRSQFFNVDTTSEITFRQAALITGICCKWRIF